ncbi:hypothetical protein ACI79J_12850 [Geodermatophilus sp. SYSU D01062]
MGDFADVSCGCGGGDPSKRVRYTRGMVLGEDDLDQEQLYLRARDHLGLRALHGSGTLSGLHVLWDVGTGRLTVMPGLAVDPVGRLVCVPTEQCADLARWVEAHEEELVGSLPVGAVPATTALYVVLCHRECETDAVPVPSQACRTAEESMAPSRVQDSFELRILTSPPLEPGEDADGALRQLVDRLADVLDSVPEESLADNDSVRHQLVSWVTRHRPELGSAPCLAPPADNCGQQPQAPSTAVLLARIDLRLGEDVDGRLVLDSPPVVVQDDRPVALSSRFLQEWLIALALYRRPPIAAPPVEDHNVLDNLAVGDVHTQYLPADGSRPLLGDLDAGGNALTRLGPSTAPHHAVRVDEVFFGDLGRTAGGARLEQLQGRPVAAATPQQGDVLTFDGASWVPGRPAGGRPGPLLPLVTIRLIGSNNRQDPVPAVFLLWFHLDVPGNEVVLVTDPTTGGAPLEYDRHLRVAIEECGPNGDPRLSQVSAQDITVRQVECNLFRAEVTRVPATLLRFTFNLRQMFVGVGAPQPLTEYARDRGVTWVGQGDEDTVTEFVLNPSALKFVDGFEDVVVLPAPWGGTTVRIG